MIFIDVVYFFIWTFFLYWIHRAGHRIKFVQRYHLEHHKFVNQNGVHKSKWEWNNLFLFNDNKNSTLDLWITEVLPTLVFSFITGAWWIFFLYYVWAALFQEILEHKQNFNLPIFTAGQWHLQHHRNYKTNFGLFLPIWDILFGTYKKV